MWSCGVLLQAQLLLQLVFIEFSSIALLFSLHKGFCSFKTKICCSSCSIVGLFFLSWVIQVQAGQTWETIYLVANHRVFSTGTDPSGKILAGIQQPVAISPWFYGQKDEGTKLFYFSTKASYHWDNAHHYNNNSSVVKTFKAYKSHFRLTRSGETGAESCHHWLPVPVLTGRLLHNALKRREQEARLATIPPELSCPPSPTPVSGQHGCCWLLVRPLIPMLHSQQELAFPQAPALTKKESKEHITLLFHREPKLAQRIISRWNVCNHQIHPSSLGAVIFASLTCVGKKGQQRVFYLKARFPGDQKYIL